jgi:anti-sigma regulatory factor (Ser/Thr protein kinase)
MQNLVLPAKLENLEAMLKFIVDQAKVLGFDEKKIFQIQLAAEEALVNVINYAYPGKNGEIKISLMPKTNEALEIEIADRGIPFDPLSLPEPDICTPLEERKIGGLGVFLFRKIMDEVRYKRRDGQNILSLVKKLKT